MTPDTDQDSADQHPTRPSRAGLVGCLTFLICFVVGMAVAVAVGQYAVRGMPQAEAYEAIGRASELAGWYCGGGLLSLAVASLAGVLAARWAKGRT